ncbi:MAG: hypothetical protein BAJALOKI2v1_540007 [Promethearchaeota archaeon]|nr:MAG: hypothetical protein BAJALOKI2v1_540007 [Candidatus Lokiarchaeota archaeon]
MVSFHESMLEYRRQLKKGIIQKAYQGLMEYFGSLRSFFKKKYPDYGVSGSIYFGYMDMTYFAVKPPLLEEYKLKIAIIFLHEQFRFEVWLAGYNKGIQKKFWDLIKTKTWDKYHIPPNIDGIDSIVEHVLLNDPDFRDLDVLTTQIEKGTISFIDDVKAFLFSIA